jgi:Flp pilus assembly protein CpaB
VKKKSPPWPFIIAGVLFVICVFALYKWNQQMEADKAAALLAQQQAADAALAEAKAKQVTVTETPTNMRTVFYATQPIAPGTRISPAFFESKQTPKDILPDAFTDSNDVVGMFAIRDIEKGDPLTPRNVGKSLPYMSQRISPGMRALSLQVFNSELNDTGGFIVDGDKVDLLFTVASPDNSIKLNTQTVMQNVSVLYVPGPQIKTDKTSGITPAPPPGDPVAVTFEVTPEQAQALIFLTNLKNGEFSMILRARRDDQEVKIKPFVGTDYDILNLGKVQKTVDRSVARVQELSEEIEAKEKANAAAAANTNETTNPIPPTQ